MPTRHQRDPRVARCDQTHLAVVVVRLWCIDLTVGLAVDVDHISVTSIIVDVFVLARMKARVDITWTVLQHEYTELRFHCTYQQ